MSDDLIVKKPWGFYKDYFRDEDCVFKMIVVKPGEQISYQVHQERSEFWFISKGKALIKTSPFDAESAANNYTMSEMEKGDFILINNNQCHQVANNGDDDLVIYEMQFGNCSEEDIIRLQDPYKRQ